MLWYSIRLKLDISSSFDKNMYNKLIRAMIVSVQLLLIFIDVSAIIEEFMKNQDQSFLRLLITRWTNPYALDFRPAITAMFGLAIERGSFEEYR